MTAVLVDANLLVYAALPTAAEHERSRRWLTDSFGDPELIVGLTWGSLYAFVRIVSNRRIVGDDAVSVPNVWAGAESYRQQSNVLIVEPGAAHAAIAGELIGTPGLSANDVADVALAAIAIERGLVLATHDHGFARFRDLRWTDPLR